MGRNVKARANYRADSTYLQRLIGVVEADPRFPIETKRRIMKNLRQVSVEFMSVPTQLEKESG